MQVEKLENIFKTKKEVKDDERTKCRCQCHILSLLIHKKLYYLCNMAPLLTLVKCWHALLCPVFRV